MGPVTSTLPASFKAVQVDKFGGIDSMHYRDVPLVHPAAGQVLVRVAAAGVGPWDAWIRSGNSVLPQPLPLTLGSDIAGTVVLTGEGVNGFILGEDVFGVTNPRFTDAYAEYAIADAGMVARKPSALSFEEAASLPVIAVTAWQMLFEQAHVTKGDRVLVLGGAGNVGAFAVQLAHHAGAFVIASASRRDADFVTSLGADQVFDTREQSFDEYRQSVDVVIDLVGGETLDRSFETVKPGGRWYRRLPNRTPSVQQQLRQARISCWLGSRLQRSSRFQSCLKKDHSAHVLAKSCLCRRHERLMKCWRAAGTRRARSCSCRRIPPMDTPDHIQPRSGVADNRRWPHDDQYAFPGCGFGGIDNNPFCHCIRAKRRTGS
jgi:NADPH:quinone reductase-like Zn-dependent oxidoreductase